MGPDSDEPGLRTSQAFAELEVQDAGNFTIQQVATIGRSSDSHIALNVRSVSRHHARIFYEGGHFWIKDLDSGNGTTVNGKRVKLQMLSDGDRIGFGEANAVFRSGPHAPSGPALLGRDPLEGSDPALPDGTPTGGLKGFYPQFGPTEKVRREPVAPPVDISEAAADLEPLRSRLEKIERENESLRQDLARLQSADLPKENDRLRRLVAQLERALADSNVRIRNLQQRLGP